MKKILLAVATIAVMMCTMLMAVSVNAENKLVIRSYTVDSDGNATITDVSAEGDIIIPSTLGNNPVTGIGISAFEKCYEITSVVIPEGVTVINNKAFYNCTNLKSVTIPDSVKKIGTHAFAGCSSLSNVTIPNGITAIEQYTFSSCDRLTSVTISEGVTTIADRAFQECDNLKSVIIPNTVTTIGEYVFYNCKSLTDITIPDGVETIGRYAFKYCDGLTSITIPKSVTQIKTGVFSGCDNLKNIDVVSENENYCSIDGVLFNKEKTTIVQYPNGKSATYKIPDSVTTIGEEAFAESDSLKSVTIPNSVIRADEGAFYKCKNLTSITIPRSLTSIGYEVFGYCSGLKSVTIPDSVTFISQNVFTKCDALETVYYGGSKDEWNEVGIAIGNEPLKNATIVYNYGKTASVEVVNAVAKDDSLMFVSQVKINGDADISAFGTTVIPLWLFDSTDATVDTIEYDNANYSIKDGQTYGATITKINDNDRKNTEIVAKSYIINNGKYTWSSAKSASFNNPVLTEH